jgi:hypothetical protein
VIGRLSTCSTPITSGVGLSSSTSTFAFGLKIYFD